MNPRHVRGPAYAVTIACLFQSALALAGVNSWTTHGPMGGEVGDVLALAIEPGNPQIIFAGTSAAGVFKSTDGAASWQPANNGLPFSIRSLTFDSATPSTLYAVTDGGVGLFATGDRGGHWTQLHVSGPSIRIRSLAIDPQAPQTLYLGMETFCTSGSCPGGVLKSTNRGTTWLPSSNGLPQFDAPAVYPVTSTTLYSLCIRFENGLFKSVDGGATWTALKATAQLPLIAFGSMALDPRNPSTLYLAGAAVCSAIGGTCSGSVFRSTDSGAHWTSANGNLPYGIGNGRNYSADLVVDPTTSDVYAGGALGLWKTPDGGQNWSPTGLGQGPRTLTIDPTDPARLYAGDSSGVRRSTDAGHTWTSQNTGIVSTTIRALAVDSQTSRIVYAGTPSHFFKSVVGGGSWVADIFEGGVKSVVCDPALSGTVYAVGTGGSINKSTDAGGSWGYAVFSPFAEFLVIDPLNPQILLAIGTKSLSPLERGLFKTTDGGSSWNEVATFPDDATLLRSVAVDPKKAGTLYAGSYAGVRKSTDGGVNWITLAGSPASLDYSPFPIAIDPQDSSTVYATGGHPGFGVFKSSDGGLTWTNASSGLPASGITSLVIDPLVHTTIYAGTPVGVFRTADSGAAWTAFNTGLTDMNVTFLAINRFGTLLHAGTVSGGVFDYQITRPSSCSPDPVTLCLSSGRFSVRADWSSPSQGTSGQGTAVSLTGDTGYFWFFSSSNVEMIVKVLDGCGINGHEWVFAGGLTDVEVALAVTDTQTGEVQTYVNPAGTPFRPIQDTASFLNCPPTANNASFSSRRSAQTVVPADKHEPDDAATRNAVRAYAETMESCAADATTLCLSGNRFRVQSSWRSPSQGTSGHGTAVSLTSDTGYFWFFSASNVEMVVKVLDACTLNSHKWVFAGGLTNVEVTLTVTDTQTGAVKTYVNPADTAFLPIQDTAAFGTCP